MGGSGKVRASRKPSVPTPQPVWKEEGGLSPRKERSLAKSGPMDMDRPKPSRRGSLADMLHFTKKSSSASKIDGDGKSGGSRQMPAKSPKLFRLRAKSVKKRHQSSPIQDSDHEAEAGARRFSAQPTLFDSEQGFIITPPDSFSGKSRLAEMVSRMKGYHSVSVDLESLPALVISTMVTLSVHTSFPTPLYLYMLARNEGNSRATCEDLVNLGWGQEEGEARAAVSRTITSRKDVHFTTPYYHGNIPLKDLVKKILHQKVGSYLTYVVVQDHTFQYYCLFVSDNQLYMRQRDAGHATVRAARSASPPKHSISPLRRTRARKTRSPVVSPDTSPRLDKEAEKGVIVCAAIEAPTVSDDFLFKNACCFPLLCSQAPSTRFVPFLNEHASQKSSPGGSLKESTEDPNYTLELLGVLTAALPLEQRIFKYNSKLDALKEELEGLDASDPRGMALKKCCEEFKEKIQQLKLSLYGQDADTSGSSGGSTCGFLSFSDMALPPVTPSTSLVPDAGDAANPLRESESLTVGFLWAVDDA